MSNFGSIRCTTCNTAMSNNAVCPKCNKGGYVYLDVYWRGKHWPIRRDENNERLEFKRAFNILKAIQTDIDRGKFSPYRYVPAERNPNRIEMYLDRWLGDVKETLSPGTVKAYKSSVEPHIKPYWGKKDITDGVNVKAVKMWVVDLEKKFKKNSARTIRNRFHAFLVWAAEEGIIEKIPYFKKIKGNNEKKKYALTLEQQFETANKINHPVMRRAVLLMMLTGARESEILTLKKSDVDTVKKTITIRRTWSGNEIIPTTKTSEPRVIPLPALAVEINLIKDCIGDRVGDVWLFPRARSDEFPLHYRHMWRIWKATGTPATLRDATRRSYGTILKNAGVDIEKIRELYGHANSNTTRIYLEDEPTRLSDEIDEIQAKLLPFYRKTSETTETINK